jgi:hypothetical protein
LAVVLTSLLAMVGVLFVLAARIDRVGTAAVSDNRNLHQAAETVIAQISEELALDVPGVRPWEEYYDYPDPCNLWLANLEPYFLDDNGTPAPSDDVIYWRHISDVYNRLGADAENVAAGVVPAYQDPAGPAGFGEGLIADADGDGVGDSVWVLVEGMDSSKGWPIFAAIRIVDNGGMLNANTGFKFDAAETDANFIDGSSLMQINLMALATQPDEGSPTPAHETDLLEARNPFDLPGYEEDVVWRYGQANGMYTPFDISDELELRYRYIINHGDIETPLEVLGVPDVPWGFREAAFRTPIEDPGKLGEWFVTSCAGELLDPDYAYRHIATTYNMDQIIAPDGGPMVNVNRIYTLDDVNDLFIRLVREGVMNPLTAKQVAVNLKDYVDTDSEVTAFAGRAGLCYGFESPCVYISEVGLKYELDPNDPNVYNKSYAVELYKPYGEDDNPVGWQLTIDGVESYSINWPSAGQFQVTYWNNPLASFVDSNTVSTCDPSCDPNTDPNCDPNCDPNSTTTVISITQESVVFGAGSNLQLVRPVGAEYVVVDAVTVPGWFTEGGSDGTLSFQRDIARHRCIKRLWDMGGDEKLKLSLGGINDYNLPDELPIQAHPADAPLTNIGEIGMVFSLPTYFRGERAGEVIGYDSNTSTEDAVRVDLGSPFFQPLINYLTVLDPRVDLVDNDGDGLVDANDIDGDELKIAGRININTAPWFVIAQLPWMTPKIAQAVVAYRDKLSWRGGVVNYSDGRARGMWDVTEPMPPISVREEAGFASIAELVNVTNDLAERGVGAELRPDLYDMRIYGRDSIDQMGFPDLSTESSTGVDGAANDFEERDLIFARLSNLATVRSDVFTAYILVRIGTDGPQKRVVAVLDRSNVRRDPVSGTVSGRVKIRVLHPVPDAR